MLKQETSNQKVEISIDEILKQNTEFKIENEKLKHELDYFRRLIFGKKSERFISNEPTLPPNTLFTQDAELIEENKRAKARYRNYEPPVYDLWRR